MPDRTARRVTRRRWPWLLGAAAIVALIIADQRGWLLASRHDDLSRYDGHAFDVVRVLDGDTIEIDAPDALSDAVVTRVRLLGIDGPEVAGPNRPAQPRADEARALLESLIDGKPVRLALEPGRTRGVYGRVLAYVEASDGTAVNEALLAMGLARAEERWPHARLRRYAQLEQRAREGGLGIWSDEE